MRGKPRATRFSSGLALGFSRCSATGAQGIESLEDMTATVAKEFAHSGQVGQRKGVIVVPLNSRAVTLGTSQC